MENQKTLILYQSRNVTIFFFENEVTAEANYNSTNLLFSFIVDEILILASIFRIENGFMVTANLRHFLEFTMLVHVDERIEKLYSKNLNPIRWFLRY